MNPENIQTRNSISAGIGLLLPNVQDEPRSSLARLVLLGARDVTAKIVGSSAWLGSVFISGLGNCSDAAYRYLCFRSSDY